MILFVISLYIEAKPIIDFFRLKQISKNCKFPIFQKEKTALIISGIGKLNSAIATTYILQKFELTNIEKIINIGLCGTNHLSYNIGDIFLIHKITDHHTNKSFYPDMTYDYKIRDEELITFDEVQTQNLYPKKFYLADMEGFGFFQSAVSFLDHSKIHILKIVSDYLQNKILKKEFVYELISKNLETVEILLDFEKKENLFNLEEFQWMNKVEKFFQLSDFQKKEFLSLMKWYKLKYKEDIRKIKIDFSSKNTEKNENKRKFQDFKKKILS